MTILTDLDDDQYIEDDYEDDDLGDFYDDYEDDIPDWAYLQAEAEQEYAKYEDDDYNEIDPWGDSDTEFI